MEYVLFLAILFYLLPWMLAEAIEHRRRLPVLVLTLALGWLILPWIAALVWVLRDWPRAPRRPVLRVVDPSDPPRPLLSRTSMGLRSLLWIGSPLILVLIVGWLALQPPRRLPASGLARLSRERVLLRMGPDLRWPGVGELEAPCRVGLLEREGAWRRVSRMDGCGGSMRGRLGWMRVEALILEPQPQPQPTLARAAIVPAAEAAAGRVGGSFGVAPGVPGIVPAVTRVSGIGGFPRASAEPDPRDADDETDPEHAGRDSIDRPIRELTDAGA